MKVDKSFFVAFLKVLYRVLPYVISALGGGAAAMTITGCKCGSLISIVSPAI